jgi:hypothetical protein
MQFVWTLGAGPVVHRESIPTYREYCARARRFGPNPAGDEAWATPLSWAERRGHLEIAERLRGAG